MPDIDLTTLQTRAYELRAKVNTDLREIDAVGVPLGETLEVYPGFQERFDPECEFAGIDRAKLAYRHGDLIGRIAAHTRTDTALNITGRVSTTVLGDDVLAMVRDDTIDSVSIGFTPLTWREEDGVIVYTKVQVREFSLVPWPAYEGARITQTRQEHPQKETTMPETLTREDVETLLDERETQITETIERSLDVHLSGITREQRPAGDQRSPAEFLRALVDGDQTAIDAYNRSQKHLHDELQHRAYTGTTTAAAPVQDAWVGDLTRLFDSTSGVLADVFSTGTLPEKGMNIEFAELKSNTMTVTEQAEEGDDLPIGKIELQNRTAPVKTYGGATSLSIQAIKRSTLPVLGRHLEALTIAAAARKKAVLRAKFAEVIAARQAVAANGGVVVLGATLAAATADNWENALVDAALKYDDLNLPMEALIVDATVFKKLRSLTVAGERVFTVWDKNASGSLDLPGLSGNLASIPVRLDKGQSGAFAAFVNSRAIRQYDSALVSLQDDNILNLSKDFSVYRFGAIADEIPQAVIPVKLAAS